MSFAGYLDNDKLDGGSGHHDGQFRLKSFLSVFPQRRSPNECQPTRLVVLVDAACVYCKTHAQDYIQKQEISQ